jgi:CRISPR-associated protein Cmr2
MKYTAINIGPIGHTFSLARKPREFWAASYMFSYLMKLLVEEVEKTDDVTLISPNITEESNAVGLYPDRAYFSSEKEIQGLSAKIGDVRNSFIKKFGDGAKDYFNITATCVEGSSLNEVIKELNNRLDILELNERAFIEDSEDAIREFLLKPSFEKLPSIVSLETIANANRAGKSYNDYVCIVQADGDNIGTTFQHLTKDGQNTDISGKLAAFGLKASKAVENAGGLPIYAGGDDLLFIAPVVGEDDQNVFELIKKIDGYFQPISDEVKNLGLKNKDGREIVPSMSYGVSVTYEKFPLYEAWKKADKLLAQAKAVKGKNAIVWEIQKHSGSTHAGAFSKSDTSLYEAFNSVIDNSNNEAVVSAVAHKLRDSEGLFALWVDKDEKTREARIDAFFDKVIDTVENKKYKDSVKALLVELFKKTASSEDSVKDKVERLSLRIYGMLRTAKFINGEEDK